MRTHQKPSVRVKKDEKQATFSDEKDKVSRADNVIDLEIYAAKHHHPYDRVHLPNPRGIVLGLVHRHEKIIQKREDERRRKRLAKLDSTEERHQDVIESSNHLQSSASSFDSTLFNSNVVDTLDVVDASVNTVGTLSDITRSILVPTSWAGSAPVVELKKKKNVDNKESGENEAAIQPGFSPLDEHVKDQLDKKEDKMEQFKRIMHGVYTFVKTPLGVVVAIYGFFVVFSGAALVICLAGWVPGNKKEQVEIFSQSTNALFTITGVGLIPWRLRDTYLIARICHFRNLSNKLRRKAGLDPLEDPNDLAFESGHLTIPKVGHLEESDSFVEKTPKSESSPKERPGMNRFSPSSHSSSLGISLPSLSKEDEHMLHPHQATNLRLCQKRFAQSCTWYRPTETATHRAFPIGWAVAITAFNDGNSLFQCCMCGFMWGYATHYKDVSGLSSI